MLTVVAEPRQLKIYEISAKCKCSECGKIINKTFSFKRREDIEPTNRDWDNLEKEKDAWKLEKHICNSCKIQKVAQEREDVTSSYTFMLSKLDELQRQIEQVVQDKVQRINCLEELKGKVLIDKNSEEWVIESIREGSANNIGFEITCYRINKRKPWLLTEDCRYFTNDKTVWNNFSTLDGCVITNEEFEKRAELLKN